MRTRCRVSRTVRAATVAAALAALVGCGLQPQVVHYGTEPSPTTPFEPDSASPSTSSGNGGVTTTPTPTPTPTPTSMPTPTATGPASPPPTKAPERPKLPPDPAQLPGAPAGSRGVVYLTFDDGPSTYTRTYLDILSRYHSTATFFQLGINVPNFPVAVAAVRAQGSAIGNHTYDHHDLALLTKKQMRAEWQRGPQVRCGRPPYGATNAKVVKVMKALHLRQVLWDVDTVDWSRPGAEIIYRRGARAAVHNGSIVLMHDGGGDRGQSVQALPRILQELQRRGYVIRKLPGC